MDAIDLAIDACGSISELARRIGVKPPAIHQWEAVPADRVLTVAEATGWRVTPHKMRPDLYPNQTDGMPDHLFRCEPVAK